MRSFSVILSSSINTASLLSILIFQMKTLYKICGLLLFIGVPCAAVAQYEHLLNNADIAWAAEIEVTYSLKPPPTATLDRENDIVFWKSYDPKALVQYDGGEMLIRKMLDAALSGAWPAWQVNDPNKPLELAAVAGSLCWSSADTIVTFDPVTGEAMIQLVQQELDPADFTAIRARQLLYYDDKKGEFGLATIAVAPVFTYSIKFRATNTAAERDTILYENIPFWLKTTDFRAKSLRKHPNVNDARITWAAQIKTLGNSPEPDQETPVKNTKAPIMQVVLDRFRYDRRYLATDFYNTPLPFNARAALFVSTDTLVRYDQETYAETIEIDHNELRAEHTLQLRLVENWYWDDRARRLMIRLERFAPIVDGGLWKWPSRPLFYRNKK